MSRETGPAALFGGHLVDRGRITNDQLVAALDVQRRSRPLIGRIALTERILSVRQVMRILDAQVTRAGPFGEVGIELGFLTPDGLENLLGIQRDMTPKIGEILVQMGALTRAQLEEEISVFRASYRQADADRGHEAA